MTLSYSLEILRSLPAPAVRRMKWHRTLNNIFHAIPVLVLPQLVKDGSSLMAAISRSCPIVQESIFSHGKLTFWVVKELSKYSEQVRIRSWVRNTLHQQQPGNDLGLADCLVPLKPLSLEATRSRFLLQGQGLGHLTVRWMLHFLR